MGYDIQLNRIRFNGGTQYANALKGDPGGVSDVQINGTSIADDGIASIPISNASNYGVVKTADTCGTGITSSGLLAISSASESNITSRNSVYKPIAPSRLNFAVKAALTDANRDTTYTDAQKANACDTIGAWRRPSDGWVLKGTITNGASSVAVDLTGCTELYIKGTGTATGTVSVNSNLHYLFSSALTDTKKVFAAHWIDGCGGFESIMARSNTSLTAISLPTSANAYSNCAGNKISEINRIILTGAIPDDINVQIYAR